MGAKGQRTVSSMPSESGDKEKNVSQVLANYGGKLLDRLVERFSSGKGERIKSTLILPVFTAFILAILILPSQQFLAVRYKAGEIAAADIKASQDYLVEDLELTEKKRSEAEVAAPYIYAFDPRGAEKMRQRFEKTLNLITQAREGKDEERRSTLRGDIADALGFEISDAEYSALTRLRGDRSFLNEIGRLAERIYNRRIVADKRLFESDILHGIVIVNSDTGQENGIGRASGYLDISEARGLVRNLRLSGFDRIDPDIVSSLLQKAVQPNVVFNREATEQKRQAVRNTVAAVLFQVKRGEMIVREGERITEQQALKLRKIYDAPHGVNRLFKGIGIFLLVLVFLYFPYRFARKNIRKFNPSSKDLLFLVATTCGLFLLLKISLMVSTALSGVIPYMETEDYYYVFPFAIGAMLVRIVLNSEVALVYAVVCAPLVGIMFNSSLPVAIYCLMGGVVGAHGVRQCKDRGTIYSAGLKVSVVNLAIAISFQILTNNLFTVQTIYIAIFAFAGGILNALFVTGTIPLVETLFHYTTDIKLLELANLNSPVLRELMIRAPGTYHHSVLVGNMVEAAAEAINANPLLARVAAYYHDIGKVSKPLYFIENVTDGDNRHDRLSPNMSALILISHVKEGVELAKENRLGRPIIDIIKQSHGTALISFFYQKAKNLQEPEVQSVNERDFRYPGPKPQTREAGLVMLADAVEAASRTLTDPTPSRIQGMVQKIINNIFIDGQLDECELTLKNLHEIAKSFNRILSGIFHQRIDYPEPAFKVSGGKKSGEDSDREPAKASTDKDEESKKGSGEDLKRLGITR